VQRQWADTRNSNRLKVHRPTELTSIAPDVADVPVVALLLLQAHQQVITADQLASVV
jgi:hypothetical protein